MRPFEALFPPPLLSESLSFPCWCFFFRSGVPFSLSSDGGGNLVRCGPDAPRFSDPSGAMFTWASAKLPFPLPRNVRIFFLAMISFFTFLSCLAFPAACLSSDLFPFHRHRSVCGFFIKPFPLIVLGVAGSRPFTLVKRIYAPSFPFEPLRSLWRAC